ncbi:hypothetical protein SLEP1_g46064 [Rubroshorea leprosula]|uniref:Cytochrome P450 n=1 Tax=Rubroshorea leprosula TaxID=152421 RepID=A0AAV5LMR9_9ROSI|nr:hypothetical protein SLEP1_g46064 [Rubroshorea leprosula]
MIPISDFSRLFFTSAGIFAIVWYAWTYFKSRKRISKLPPGPPGLPLVGNLPFLDPELHTYFAAVARKYGPVVKLQLGTRIGILITSPALAREVLKDHGITFANHDMPAVGGVATYGGSDIVWNPYGPEWRMLRKVCAVKMLSNTTLDSVYTLRRREVRGTVAYINSRGDQRAALGAEFREVISDITELLGLPNISDFFPALARFDLQGLAKRMGKLAKKLDTIFDRIIEQRLKYGDEEENKDFLQFLLKLKDEGDPNTPFTMTHVRALLMDMVVGGSDTSSNSIEFEGTQHQRASSSNPGAGSSNPGAGSSNPGAGSSNPGAGSSNPGAGFLQRNPGAGSSNPGAGFLQRNPGAGFLQRNPGPGFRESGEPSTPGFDGIQGLGSMESRAWVRWNPRPGFREPGEPIPNHWGWIFYFYMIIVIFAT